MVKMTENGESGRDDYKSSLKDWLMGDDRGLVSWITRDASYGDEEELEELFAARKRIMQLEDDLAMLKRQLHTTREDPGVRNIDEILAQRPVMRNYVDRYQSQLDTLADRVRETVASAPSEIRNFVDIYEMLNRNSQILRDILSGIRDKPEQLDEYAEVLKKRSGEMNDTFLSASARIEEIQGMMEKYRLQREFSAESGSGLDEAGAAELVVLKNDNERLNRLLQQRDEESEKMRSLLRYKEEELARQEEDLIYRERLLEESKTKFDAEWKDLEGLDAVAMEKRLEHLRKEIQRKEEEMIQKEKYLGHKMEELRNMELGLIGDEIELREEERRKELAISKVHTGNQRFNDLLLGGFPFGTNIMLHGPAFVGKEILLNEFMAEGLKKGVPVIWVITDRTIRDVRIAMEYVLPGYGEYENLGLVKYVDCYSRTIGMPGGDANAVYLDSPADHAGLTKAVDDLADAYLKDHEYYRLGFQSLSSFVAYSDSTTAFRFLSPFTGKRRGSKAVCLYLLERGMHSEQDIRMLSMIMDGVVDFHVDQMRTFLTVTGVGDVQTRGDVRYTWSNHGLSIGSFTLDHIR